MASYKCSTLIRKFEWDSVGPVLLAVVYTVRSEGDEVIRLISARKAYCDE